MTHAFVYSLGMTLLHSLWQITIIYLLLKVLLISFKNWPSNWKYNLSGAAMVSSFLIAALTFFIYYQGEKTDLADSYGLISGLNTQQISILSAENASMGQESGTSGISAFLPHLVYIYLVGLILLILRLIFSLIYLRKYRYNGIVKLDETLNTCFESLVHSFNFRKEIKIRESLIAKVPMVLGYFKPVVIVPAGLLTQLPFNQVEAILSHELAHIRRNDFLSNLIQSVIELLFFYHPAIYLISKRIREERENCCDDIALSFCNDSTQYVKALASMEGAVPANTFPAVAFVKKKNNLLNRMKRILNPETMKTKFSDRIIAGIIILAGFFTLTITGAAALNNISGEHNYPMENNTSQEAQLNKLLDDAAVEKDTIVDFDENTVITHRKNKDGEKEKVEMTFENGKLTELIIDGKVIPEDKYKNYRQLISETRSEVAKASKEVEEAEKELEEIDTEEIEREVEEALAEARELNEEEIRMEIQQALAEIEQIEQEEIRMEVEKALKEAQMEIERARAEDVNWDSIQMEINNAMEEIDWEQIQEEIRTAMEEADMNEEEIERAIDEATRALDEIDWDEINESIELGIQGAMEGLEAIEWDVIRESLEMSLDITADVLSDIHVEIDEALREIDIERDIEVAKEDVRKEKEKLKELENNMEKALEELEKK